MRRQLLFKVKCNQVWVKFQITFPRFSTSCGSLKAVNSLGLPYRLTKHGPNVGRKPRLSSTAMTQNSCQISFWTGWNAERWKWSWTGWRNDANLVHVTKQIQSIWSEFTVVKGRKMDWTVSHKIREGGGRTARMDGPWRQVIWMRREEGWFRITDRKETDELECHTNPNRCTGPQMRQKNLESIMLVSGASPDAMSTGSGVTFILNYELTMCLKIQGSTFLQRQPTWLKGPFWWLSIGKYSLINAICCIFFL